MGSEMVIPDIVMTLIGHYETVVLNYRKLSQEQKEELEELYLFREVADIIKENNFVREIEVDWTNDIKVWPEELFVIGNDGCGNYYYLDQTDNTVGFYDHDEMTFTKEANNIQLYANKISQFLENDE